MGKRVAIIILVFLVSGLGILGYFLQQSRKNLVTDPYKAISQEAGIIIETSDVRNLLNSVSAENGIFGELGKVKELGNFTAKLKFLSDQLNQESFKKILSGTTAIFAFYPDENGRLSALLSMSIPAELRIRHIKEALHSAGIDRTVDKKISGKQILLIPFRNKENPDTVFIQVNSGLLVAATSSDLFQKAQNQILNQTDIRNAPGFSRILLASGKNEDKLFIVFENLNKVAGALFGSDNTGLARKIANLAGSAEGDIFINENGLLLSGYAESVDSGEILHKFKFISPVTLQTYKVLPASTVMFETVVIPENRPDTPAGISVPAELAGLSAKLQPFIGDEVTRAYIDIRNKKVNENFLIIYELNNRVQCEQVFLEALNKKPEINYFQPDDQTKIPVYFTGYKGFASTILPGFAPGFEDSYFTFFDNFLITGNSFVTVSRFLYDNILNKTLSNDLSYRAFETTLPSRASYLFYCVPPRLTDYLSGFLNDNIIAGLKANRGSLSKIQAAGYQIAASNEMIYNSLSVSFREEVREESTTEWETLLDTVAAIKPFFFTNHTTGAREIFIQDLKNNAYLINAAGRVLWKVPLRERIVSSVFMIDYYRNGKYQLLFSGSNNIHLLDRNGNYVERYPVRLRSPASNSLSVFDYDNNRDYRLLVAGEDKQIYSYDKTGSIVKGWKPFKTAGIVSDDIGFFRVSGKDYLVFADDISVYFLDRTGNIRLRPDEAVTKAPGSKLRLGTGSRPSVVCSSPDGSINHIYFNGEVKKFTPKSFSGDHSFDFFDVDGDSFGEYIFIDKGILYLYDNDLGELFTRDLGSEELGGPINFIFSSSDRKIGVYDKNKNLIYLIDRNGDVMDGFPLRGASMFSIGKLSDKSGWHLIVGGTDRFLYNYRLNTEIN